jgi:hypothetical protein
MPGSGVWMVTSGLTSHVRLCVYWGKPVERVGLSTSLPTLNSEDASLLEGERRREVGGG